MWGIRASPVGAQDSGRDGDFSREGLLGAVDEFRRGRTDLGESVVFGPDGVAVAVGASGFVQPLGVVEVSADEGAGLVGSQEGQAALHFGGVHFDGGQGVEGAGVVVGFVVFFAAGALGGGGGERFHVAVAADGEFAVAGEEILAAFVTERLAVAAVDGAGAPASAGELRVVAFNLHHLLHHVPARDAVEPPGEDGARHELLLGLARDRGAHGPDIGRRGAGHVLQISSGRDLHSVAKFGARVVTELALVAGERRPAPIPPPAQGSPRVPRRDRRVRPLQTRAPPSRNVVVSERPVARYGETRRRRRHSCAACTSC
jgi:hypothetical protein